MWEFFTLADESTANLRAYALRGDFTMYLNGSLKMLLRPQLARR
jgi:hypothetical protein